MKWMLIVSLFLFVYQAPVSSGDTAVAQSEEEDTAVEGVEETMVVTASKTDTPLIEAPATMTVIKGEELAESPFENFGDILQTIPGVNVTQTSARDVNFTIRQATTLLSNQQLGLVDGRSINLDFFGFIQWDLVSVDFDDIKQIEVVRGPASAVWGSNAKNGVVNIITKSPRENPGTTVTLYGGLFSRDFDSLAGEGTGNSGGASFSHSQILDDTWSYRLSGAYFNSNELARPVGQVPASKIPGTDISTGGGFYPPYQNSGTSQPKLDFRLDQILSDDSNLVYSAGIAYTSGTFFTPTSVFELLDESHFGYGKVNYNKGNLKLQFFANVIDVESLNLFAPLPDGGFIKDSTKAQNYDFEAGHAISLGQKQLLSFGGNFRHDNFEITLAPSGDNRNEAGAYIQDEIYVDKWRFALGARVDKFSVIDHAVFSPRLTATFYAAPDQSIRVSFNRAFRSPALVENFVNTSALTPIELPTGTYLLPITAIGNQELEEESTDAFEIGYTGQFNANRTLLSVSYYVYNNKNNIQVIPIRFYGPENPPPGWPLPPAFVPPFTFPETLQYENVGGLRNQGFEIAVDHRLSDALKASANYSYQKDPEIREAEQGQIPFPVTQLNFPATNRLNASLWYENSRYIANGSMSYVDSAFWNDILDLRFHGPTDSYTMLNALFGVKWMKGRVVSSIRMNNLLNKQVQEHIFGDFLGRSVTAELRFQF